MASITIKATACSGGGHADIAVTGDVTFNLSSVPIDDLLEPLDMSDRRDRIYALRVMLALLRIGRTKAQLRNHVGSQNGATVSTT